jgi:hypothetical protein
MNYIVKKGELKTNNNIKFTKTQSKESLCKRLSLVSLEDKGNFNPSALP